MLTVALVFLLALIALNVIAFIHARAMTHFADAGTRTEPPERLSWPQKLTILLTGVRIPRPANDVTPSKLHLPYEVHRFRTADGMELEAWYIPAAKPVATGLVILFHGYSACKSKQLAEAEVFREMGLATLLVDFRGSGGSNGNETTIGVREAVDVAAACEYASARWKPKRLVLYGQSMGSVAILRAIALGEVAPDAVVLECPFDRLLTTVSHRFRAMGLPAFPAAQLLVFWGGVQCGFDGFAHNPVDYAAQVHVPSLILHGESDRRVSREEVENVFENLAGPKQIDIIPGAGHEACLAADPERWERAVAQFIKQSFDDSAR